MYRGITQLNVTHTVVSNIILKRLNANNDYQISVMRQMMEKGYDYNTDLLCYSLTSDYLSIGQAEINYMWNTVKNNKAHKYCSNDNTPKVFTANNGSRPF
jgi:hypothetical protein